MIQLNDVSVDISRRLKYHRLKRYFLILCISLQVGGMCASNAQQPSNSMENVYLQLAFWRGILGFGVGACSVLMLKSST